MTSTQHRSAVKSPRPAASSGSRSVIQWVITAAWVVIALAVPVYRVLPANVSNVWVYVTFGLVIGTLLLGRGAYTKWWGVWVFAGFAAIAATITSSGRTGLGSTLEVGAQLFIIVGLAPFALRGAVVRDPRVLGGAAVAFCLAQSVSAVAGIAQLFGYPVLGWAQVNQRSPGLAGHPNVLGVMAAVAVLICTAALIYRRGPRPITFAVLALNVAALLATGSLSAMMACAVGALILLYSHGYRVLRIIFVSALAILAILAVMQIPVVASYLRDPLQRFTSVTGQGENVGSIEIREETYDAAWAWIAHDPFLGRGINAENAASRDAGTVVHNMLLRAWYQGGIILALAFAVILLAVLIVVLQSIIRKQNALAAGILVTMMTYALTSSFFEQSYYWLPVLAAWASLPRAPRSDGRRISAPRMRA